MNLMRSNRHYSQASETGGSPFVRSTDTSIRMSTEHLAAIAAEQRIGNLIAALNGTDVLVLPGERSRAAAEVRKGLGLPVVPEPEIVEDVEDTDPGL